MFRKLKRFMRETGFLHLKRRKRRYAPNLSESAGYLEDRQLLSAGAGKENVASAATPAVSTPLNSTYDTSPAGLYVIGEYQSILLRTPSDAEVAYWVPALRSGAVNENGFRNILLNSTERQQLLLNAGVNLNGSPASFVSSLYANVLHENSERIGL